MNSYSKSFELKQLSTKLRTCFEVARVSSYASNGGRMGRKMGAALYSGPRLLAIGWNVYGKTHPSSPWSIHAEQMALVRRQYYQLGGLTLFVARYIMDKNSGKTYPACARPCSLCMGMIREAGVRTIWYTDVSSYRRMKISGDSL